MKNKLKKIQQPRSKCHYFLFTLPQMLRVHVNVLLASVIGA